MKLELFVHFLELGGGGEGVLLSFFFFPPICFSYLVFIGYPI